MTPAGLHCRGATKRNHASLIARSLFSLLAPSYASAVALVPVVDPECAQIADLTLHDPGSSVEARHFCALTLRMKVLASNSGPHAAHLRFRRPRSSHRYPTPHS